MNNEQRQQKIVRFSGHNCVVKAERYASTGHTALSLYDAKRGNFVAGATLNFPDVPLSPKQVFIKDYSENEGMLKALEQAEIIKVMGVYVPTGVGSLPVCELLIDPPGQETTRSHKPNIRGTLRAQLAAKPSSGQSNQPKRPKAPDRTP